MEDITYTNINFIENKNHSISLFAIYDGHNGKFVSEYLNKNIPKILYSKIEKNDELTKLKEENEKQIITMNAQLQHLEETKESFNNLKEEHEIFLKNNNNDKNNLELLPITGFTPKNLKLANN